MTTILAFPHERLLDYFVRVMAIARQEGAAVQCEHHGHRFVTRATMTTTDVVNEWFDSQVATQTPAIRK
jgi:hypothetical protein